MKLFYYQLKNIIRTKEIVFWSLLFPFVLGTLFYVTFGTVDSDNRFSKIPVGVVWEQKNESFKSVLDEMDGELFSIREYRTKEAQKALQTEAVKALIVVGDKITVRILKTSIEASIVETFCNAYVSGESALFNIAEQKPQNLSAAMHALSDEGTGAVSIVDNSVRMEEYNPYITYFYALIAMTALFASFFSQGIISEMQADQSALGARKSIAPISKFKLLAVDILATWLISFLEIVLVLVYLVGILKLNFGADIKYMVILGLVGSYFGISLGIFTTLFIKGDFAKKNGVLLCITLVMSFFGGLMLLNVIDEVERHAPILNRINPAALMVHAFYSLRIYGSSTIFYRNLAILMLLAVIMNVASVWVLRRKRYAAV